MKKTLTLVIAAASLGLVAENKVTPPVKDTKVAVGKKVQLVMDKKQLEKEKLAAELLELSDVPKNIEKVKMQIQSMQDRMLARMKDKTDAKKIAAYKQNTAKLINDSLDWNKIKVDFVKLYTKNYSAEDMKGIIAFYKTAAGKKMLEQKQNMMRQEMMVMQNQFRKIMPQLRKMQMELRGQDRPRGRTAKKISSGLSAR